MHTITLRGHVYKIETERDDCMGPPWKEYEGCGIVSDWTTRNKKPGELVLNTSRGARRFYDFAQTMKKAKAEHRGIKSPEGLTQSQVVEAAVRRDFKYLQQWCCDVWNFVRVKVTGPDGDLEILGGFESTDKAGKQTEEATL